MEKLRKNKDKIKKFRLDYYNRMSAENFDEFCQRLLTLHTSGIYVPPSEPHTCNNKKRKARGPRKYKPEEKKRATTFGQGRVGVSCESFGIPNCQCCRPKNNGWLEEKIIIDPNSSSNDSVICIDDQNIADFYDKENMNLTTWISTSGKYVDKNSDLKTKSQLLLQELLDKCEDKPNNMKAKDTATIVIPDNSVNDSVICIDDQSISDLYDNKENMKLTSWISQNEKYVDKNSDLKRKSQLLLQSLLDKYENEDNIKKTKTPAKAANSVVQDKAMETPEPAQAIELSCPICFESLKNVEVMTTLCGHIYCSPCIQTAIKNTKSCPTCRKKLSLKSIHPIFI